MVRRVGWKGPVSCAEFQVVFKRGDGIWEPSVASPPGFRYPRRVSPTVLRVRGYRFYFFSREELRPHVHVEHAAGEAKFWLEPVVELEHDYGMGPVRIRAVQKLVEEL